MSTTHSSPANLANKRGIMRTRQEGQST